MRNLICLILVGLIGSMNAQGITNTLGGNTAAEKFIIKNSDSEAGLVVTGEGNVGIGTTSPSSKLHIYDNVNSSLSLRLHNASTGTGAATKLYFDGSNLAGIAVFGSSYSGSENVMRIFNNRNSPYGTIDFVLSGSKKMVIDNTGNVGIGTTNPLSKLSVGGDGNEHAAIYGAAAGGTGRGVYGIASNSGGMINYGGHFVAAGGKGRGVYGYASNSGVDTNYGGYFVAVGVGGCGVYGYATGTYGQGVRGDGQAFDFYAAGPGTNYGATSSIRWKKNIVEIDNPLEKLAELRGVYFDWDEEHGGHHDVGMIAEEVGKVLPEIVVYEANGIDADGMDYSKLTPLLVEAVNELQQIVEAQQKRIEELENR